MSRTNAFVVVGASLMSIAILGPLAVTRAQGTGGFANFEAAQTRPIRLSLDGKRLYAVNTPNHTLSVFDVSVPSSPTLLAEIPVGVEPVSVIPRTSDEVWVVNQVSDSVSIVSVSKGIVTDTIHIKDEPMDIVFPNSVQAFVSASRSNQIAIVNIATHLVTGRITLFGGNPRSLAISPDGTKVYAAFAISGNGTTLIPPTLAPPQSPPTNPKLPPPPHVGLIVSATDPNWVKDLKFSMPDNDVAIIKAGTSPSVLGYYSGVGTINLGLAVNPANGDLFVANTDALNTTHFETNLRGHFVNNRITRIQVSSGQITPFDLNPTVDYTTLPNPADLAISLAQPTFVQFDPSGSFMYVAAFGTDRVAVVDTNGNVLSRIEVALPSGQGSLVDPRNKRGPRGLALNPSTQRLYVMNRISNTISIVDTTLKTVIGEVPVGTDPTPLEIKQGRGFLYDAKLSGSGNAACGGCHIDGDMDHLAWDLGDPGGTMSSTVQNGVTIYFHPMKGPMTTQTLKGLANLSPYHWRGDKSDFSQFNPAFDKLMGGTQLSAADMTTYTNFANSILYQPNPNQNLDRSFPATIAGGSPGNGLNDYVTLVLTGVGRPGRTPNTCNGCHLVSPSGPGSNRFINPTGFQQPMKNPQLRNEYQKLLRNPLPFGTGLAVIDGFGMDHDGNVANLKDFFEGDAFTAYTAQERLDMAAFLLCFDTGTAPAVGYTRTLTASNVTSASVQKDWNTLQIQAAAGDIDLIARGTISGQVHGLLYQPSTNNYIAETGSLGPYTLADLQNLIQHGDTLSIMGVYPGTGTAAK